MVPRCGGARLHRLHRANVAKTPHRAKQALARRCKRVPAVPLCLARDLCSSRDTDQASEVAANQHIAVSCVSTVDPPDIGASSTDRSLKRVG